MRTERGRRGTGGSAHARPRHICTETGLTPCHICTGTWARPCHICLGTGLRPAPSKQVRAGASPVLVEMWQSWCRCGRGEPSPGVEVVRSEPSPCVDKAGVSPVPVRMRHGPTDRTRTSRIGRSVESALGSWAPSLSQKRQHANCPECTVSVPVQMLAGVTRSPAPAQMRRRRSRRRCGPVFAISA